MAKLISPAHRTCFLFIFLTLFGACQSAGNKKSENTQQATIKKKSQYQSQAHIPCFVYHRFGNSKYPSTNIAIDSFRAHLKYLKKNNFTVLTLGEAVRKVKRGEKVPENTVVLTIDDGYKSFLTGAMPLLEEFGYSATLFVNTETVGSNQYLSWDALREIHNKGIEIGNHSHSHGHFVNKTGNKGKQSFIADTKEAQKLFKEKLGIKPSLYAYPYGEYTSSMQSALKDMGFTAATAQKSGVLSSHVDLFAIPRFPMAANFAKQKRFEEKANMNSLPVTKEITGKTLVDSDNPPQSKIKVKKGVINPNNVQCFVGGSRDCSLKVDTQGDEIIIKVRATEKLKDRRTLYTLTAPSTDGSAWYWYSHLWIRPDLEEPY